MHSLFSHRANADTLSESIVCFNMVIKLLHCFFSQHSAVMSFIHIQDHCKIKFDSVMRLNWNVKVNDSFLQRCYTSLTIGDIKQGAVWCVEVTSCNVALLSWPVNSRVFLDVELLFNTQKTNNCDWIAEFRQTSLLLKSEWPLVVKLHLS